jgi:hypothetical protein
MVRWAQSNSKKATLKQKCKDSALQQAKLVWANEQEKSLKEHLAIHQIADEYGIPPTTLWCAVMQKPPSCRESQIPNWKLSPSQEHVLLDFIKEMANRSLPLTNPDIHKYAEGILNVRKHAKTVLSHNQIPHFLDHKHVETAMHWSSPLDWKHAGALTPAAVAGHFQCVKDTETKYEIVQELGYGMDETPVLLGCPGKQWVAGSSVNSTHHLTCNETCESVTVIETICANGSTIPPTVIFKGQGFMKAWGGPENNPIDAQYVISIKKHWSLALSIYSICHSDKGYTDNVLGLAWIKHFNLQTVEKAQGWYCHLFVDSHELHCSIAFLHHASSNNIIVVGYPLHCMHTLQGLDVACFGQLMALWYEKQHELQCTGLNATKASFIQHYGEVCAHALTPSTIFAVFKATGIHPWNPEVITPSQMAPTCNTSTTVGATLPPPSPACAAIATFHQQQHTHDKSPSLGQSGSHLALLGSAPSTPQQISAQIAENLAPSSQSLMSQDPQGLIIISACPKLVITPICTCTHSIPIDPMLYSTPKTVWGFTEMIIRIWSKYKIAINKGHRKVGNKTRNTKSTPDKFPTRQLVSKKIQKIMPRKVHRMQPLPTETPQNDAAQEEYIMYLEQKCESYAAQLAVQDIWGAWVQVRLHNKIMKKKLNKSTLADGGNCDMTSKQWMSCLESEEKEKKRISDLQKELKGWKQEEKTNCKALKAAMKLDWDRYVAPFCTQRKWPPWTKPKEPKMAPVLQKFAKLKKQKVEEVFVMEESNGDGENNEE